MKKIYFAPDTTVVKVELQRMIAGSPVDQILDKNAEEIENGDLIGSRRGGIWDDEEY